MKASVIDVHTHLAPDLRSCETVDGVVLGEDSMLVIEGDRLGLPGLYDAARLAGSLDVHGLDAAWVSAPPPTYRQGLDADQTDAWVRVLDKGMRARVADQPSLGLLTYLPLNQPGVALALANDVASENNSIGWTAAGGGGSVALDDLALEPLWQLLEDAGRPLLLHPGDSPDRRLDSYYLTNLLGNMVESGIAVAQLLLSGVLDRHPSLQVILVHCGGITPALVGRWARGVATQRPGIPADASDPLVGVRSLWADTLAHNPAVVDLALGVFGADRLVLGSDYPFPMGVTDPFESVAHLEPALQALIGRNAARLLPGSP